MRRRPLRRPPVMLQLPIVLPEAETGVELAVEPGIDPDRPNEAARRQSLDPLGSRGSVGSQGSRGSRLRRIGGRLRLASAASPAGHGLRLPTTPLGESALVVVGFLVFGLGWAAAVSPGDLARAAYPGPASEAAEPDSRATGRPTATGAGAAATSPEVGHEVEGEMEHEVEEWLVDGFNVLHAVLLGGRDRNDWWNADGRGRLLEAVARRLDRPGQVRVVFDGNRPAEEPGPSGIETIFAPSADEWLVTHVKAAANPARVAVVTADRRLAARARSAGAHVVAPSEFLADNA